MNVTPVISRELRSQARVGFTYNLRVLGAAASLGVCLVFGFNYGFTPQTGSLLFTCLHAALLITIWSLVPFFTADCISRERREGTIGLLFLTPLRAREVVFAKGFVHGVRAMTLLLAVLPIITIAFLLGGTSWKETVMSACMNFGSVCWALAAGLLASSMSRVRARALNLSGLIAAVFCLFFTAMVGFVTMMLISKSGAIWLPFPFPSNDWQQNAGWSQEMLSVGFCNMVDFRGWWGATFGTMTVLGQQHWILAEAAVALFSILFLFLMVLVAALNLRKHWQEEPPSAARVKVETVLYKPVVAVGLFHRWMRHKLERNPVGWLEQRKWSGRVIVWGWLAVMVSFYSAIFYVPHIDLLLGNFQDFMAWTLLVVIAVRSCGSFQQERESRVLELLLVSPMSVRDLIYGRLRGIWGQFAAALVLLIFVWFYLASVGWHRGNRELPYFFCSSFVAIPVIGLYYSLKRATFITAFLSTLFMGVAFPYLMRLFLYIATVMSDVAIHYYSHHQISVTPVEYAQVWQSTFLLIVVQILTAIRLGKKLHRTMEDRKFAFTN